MCWPEGPRGSGSEKRGCLAGKHPPSSLDAWVWVNAGKSYERLIHPGPGGESKKIPLGKREPEALGNYASKPREGDPRLQSSFWEGQLNAHVQSWGRAVNPALCSDRPSLGRIELGKTVNPALCSNRPSLGRIELGESGEPCPLLKLPVARSE